MSDHSTFAPWPPSQVELELRAQIARVEALVEKWDLATDEIGLDPVAVEFVQAAANDVRAALDGA